VAEESRRGRLPRAPSENGGSQLLELKLEITTGPLAGKVIPVREGQALTIGRTQRSNFPIPQDTFLSGVHFSVECDGAACRLADRKSANGTFVNGARVTQAAIRDGDEVFAGQTKFLVRVVESAVAAPQRPVAPPAPPRPAAPVAPARQDPVRPEVAERPRPAPPRQHALARMAVGHWSFEAIPEGWEAVEGFGIRRMGAGVFPSEAIVSEEPLRSVAGFEPYVESQLDLVRLLVSQPQIDPAGPAPVAGVDEGRAFVVRYRTDDGRRFVQRQIYVRKGQRAGSLALTTLESDLARLEAVFNQIIAGLRFVE
jgi:hypothetical protein